MLCGYKFKMRPLPLFNVELIALTGFVTEQTCGVLWISGVVTTLQGNQIVYLIYCDAAAV